MAATIYTPREMLARLVAFPTVSSVSNLELIDFVRDYLAGHGVQSTLVYDENRDKANLFATIGPMVESGVVLSGHTDVVPAQEAGWTSDPWRLTERGGRLFGRGTCDMKGFDALALAAVPHMLASNLKAPVHLALSYDEEVGCKGAPAMVERMASEIPTPQAVIVGEPTMMGLVNGHKGSLSFHTQVTGHAVHSSRIDTGVSAVMVAARLVSWLSETMADNRKHASADDPFLPPYTTLHCGMISGGVAANVVAANCTFVTDIRPVPQDDPLSFQTRFMEFIRTRIEPEMKAIAPASGVEIIPRSHVPSLAPEPGGSAERLVRGLLASPEAQVVSYATEAGIFQRAGWSTVVVGPGDIAQAHQADEYIDIAQLEAGERFIGRLIDHLAH